MSLTKTELDKLCGRLTLGEGHEDQERAVKAALHSLLIDGKRGAVLADEVGFGKTYEALGAMALLVENAYRREERFDRILVLCKSSTPREVAGGVKPDATGQGLPAVS